jgi:hypothetical protein
MANEGGRRSQAETKLSVLNDSDLAHCRLAEETISVCLIWLVKDSADSGDVSPSTVRMLRQLALHTASVEQRTVQLLERTRKQKLPVIACVLNRQAVVDSRPRGILDSVLLMNLVPPHKSAVVYRWRRR